MNRPAELATALASVRAGTMQPFELIVSDDGDGSAESVALSYGATYVQGPRRGLGPNRNACIRAASGSGIAFVDDDVKVSAGFVERATAVVAARVVTTGWELNHRGAEPEKVTPHNPDFLGFQRVEPQGDLKSIVINATVFPAGLFQHAKFDEQIKYGYEEIDMARQARRQGFAISYDDLLWTEHFPAPSNRDGYAAVLASSRLYVTYRAYRRYESRPGKAALYAVLAGGHHVAHSVKSGAGLRSGLATLGQARTYWKAAEASA